MLIHSDRARDLSEFDRFTEEVNRGRDENLVLFLAYQKTLAWLMPANFLLVVGAAILAIIAGASILREGSFLTPVQCGVLALLSSILTIIHTKLGCEQYQIECKKLSSFHRGMAFDYEKLLVNGNTENFDKRIKALNDQVSAVLKSTTTLPFQSAIERAKKSIREN